MPHIVFTLVCHKPLGVCIQTHTVCSISLTPGTGRQRLALFPQHCENPNSQEVLIKSWSLGFCEAGTSFSQFENSARERKRERRRFIKPFPHGCAHFTLIFFTVILHKAFYIGLLLITSICPGIESPGQRLYGFFILRDIPRPLSVKRQQQFTLSQAMCEIAIAVFCTVSVLWM